MSQSAFDESRTQYLSSRIIASLMSIIGTVIFAGGLYWLASLIFSDDPEALTDSLPILMTFAAMIIGILMLAAGELIKAAVDTADNTRRMLERLRNQPPASTHEHIEPKIKRPFIAT